MTHGGWPWFGVLLLGAWHGLNPGMGWLFAVALGLQERRARAVWRALPPLAVGHGLAVGAALLAATLLGQVLPVDLLRYIVAALLVGFGLQRMIRGRHPRWVGMRVSARELATWSLLMASAHGAGLMVVPLVLGGSPSGAAGHHAAHAAILPAIAEGTGAGAAAMHTLGYLLVTGVIALVVYRKLGLRLLGRVWVNLDLVWGAALVATGLATPFL